MKNMACSLFLTERDEDYYDGLFQADGKTPVKPPAYKGRIVTTLHKAKEVRPFVERCITIARQALPHQEKAAEFSVDAERNSDEWNSWRKSENYSKWNEAIAPAVNARRRVFSLLRDKEAVQILFDEIAPRFAQRLGGYTRIMRMASVRLGDAGQNAVLELVGVHDRATQTSQKPAFDLDDDDSTTDDSTTDDGVIEQESSSENAEDDAN